ncbi:hypothetical protein EMCRGX_G034207, partial [Ephydatia muelleri]
ESLSDYMLASEVPDELLCLLCKNIATEPLQVSCCGQVFCKRCLDRNAKERNVGYGDICVKCHKKWSKSVPDKMREKAIENIMVRCYIASERGGGCSWEGRFKELRAHKSAECKWRTVTCERCQETVYHKDIKGHERDSCPSRQYECPHCPYSGTYEQVTIIHYVDGRCPDQTLKCPNGCVIRSHELESHATRCPNVPCHYFDIGCNAVMSTHEMATHEHSSQELHLKLAMEKITSLSHTIDKLRAEVRLMTQKPIAVFRMKKEDLELLRSSFQPWISPSVYTHDRGYNLHLKVSMHNSGRTLSLTVHLLPGRYDDDLPWPCQAQVSVELLNQAHDCNHHMCTVDLEALEVARAYEPDQPGYGPQDFIPFEQLQYSPESNTQFLKGDSLYFRLRVACDTVYQPWLSEFVWHRDKGTI